MQTGATDAEGVARFDPVDTGTARIRFPNRADAEWKKLRVEHPGEGTSSSSGGGEEEGGGGGGGSGGDPGSGERGDPTGGTESPGGGF